MNAAVRKSGFGLWHLRMILGGAIAGVAVVGIVASVFGLGTRETHDVLGAVAGGSVSALALKLAQLF